MGCDKVSIVLTGTIVPNTVLFSKYLDPQVRRKEYLTAIHFYRNFGTVYFLENSSYPLEEDNEFCSIPNVIIRKFPISNFPDRGKGFQEFEMLDAWINSEIDIPPKWIKVTGRYLYKNFQKILDECFTRNQSIIINQYKFAKRADVALFCTTTDFYQNHIIDMYQKCDDSKDIIVENVMNATLSKIDKISLTRFKVYLKCIAISGSTGKIISNIFLDAVNASISSCTYLLDRRYIWLSF